MEDDTPKLPALRTFAVHRRALSVDFEAYTIETVLVVANYVVVEEEVLTFHQYVLDPAFGSGVVDRSVRGFRDYSDWEELPAPANSLVS